MEPAVWVQPVHDGKEGHGVLRGVDDDLEVGISDLGQEHVHSGALLEPPAMLMLQSKLEKKLKLFWEIAYISVRILTVQLEWTSRPVSSSSTVYLGW